MMITLNPTSDPNKSRRISSSQNGGRVRDVSFSSFLDGNEETFVMKLSESDEISKSHDPKCLASKKSDDSEIDVFTAEKYFYGRVEEDESHKLDQNTELELYKSSLNSRRSLLVNNDDNAQTQLSHKSNRWTLSSSIKCKKIFLSKLGCSSCCSDKNSVAEDIDVQKARISTSSCSGRRHENDADFQMKIELPTKSSVRDTGKGIGDTRIDDFRFPVMKSNRGDEQEDAARKSLEVFRSSVSTSISPAFDLLAIGCDPTNADLIVQQGLSIDRRLKMLTWDGIDMEIPSKSKSSILDSDSDTSSDLFEIESLSTNPSTSQSQYLTRQTSDAPSVTSIESVVTATDAAVKSLDTEERMKLNSKDYGKTRRHSGILSGCYNNKAVMVAEDAHRTTTGDQQVSTPKQH